jgi:hypothetical protein
MWTTGITLAGQIRFPRRSTAVASTITRLHGNVYTSELVVDGAKALVGSDERQAVAIIREAIHAPKALIKLTAVQLDRKPKVTSRLGEQVQGALYLVLAHDGMKSQVLRGENAGRGLSHVAVVYSIRKVPVLDRQAAIEQQVTVDLKSGSPAEKTRIVVFVEKPDAGTIMAIGQTRL